MKILYVITGLAQGGAERVVCDLADKMYEKGHEVKIIYLVGDVLTTPVNLEIELINAKLTNVLSLPKVYLSLLKIVKEYRPDVVHSHMVHANILTRLLRISIPIKKLISTAHSDNEGGRLRMLAYRGTHNLADITTNVSNRAVKSFESMSAVPYNGMTTIYNGIDLDRFFYHSIARNEVRKELDINSEYKMILAVGRFDEVKNYPNLLKALYLLKEEVEYSFKLLIAGDGELRTLIEDLIVSLDLHSEVILLGRRNDIPKLMSACDLFVLSSDHEGFGLVAAEAMACKCLVVATDSGGVAEVLDNNDFLVPPANSKFLKDKIKFALNLNQDEKNNLIARNLQHVRSNFSLSNISERWISIYNEN